MRSHAGPALDRIVGPLATAVAVGGLLFGALFVWIVYDAPDWVAEVWHGLLLVGGLLSVPVGVAVYLRLRAVDEGLALTSLLFGLAGGLGGAVHGAFNLAGQLNPGTFLGDSPDPGGIFRYAASGLALLVTGWLIVAARPEVFPRALGQLALASGAVLVFIYIGRLYDFITPDTKFTLLPPFIYGLVLHPAFYFWLGRLLTPSPAPPPAGTRSTT